MANVVQIGRFAQATRLSIRTLRHYADAGLLVPAWVDPDTGYRYYSYDQVGTAELIRLLRQVQMSLAEIGQVLAASDRTAVVALLQRHETRLADDLQRQQRALAYLHRLIEQEGTVVNYHVTLKQLPAGHAALLRTEATASSVTQKIQDGYGQLAAAISAGQVAFAGPPFLSMSEPFDDETPTPFELGFPVSGPFPAWGDVQSIELPAWTVASTVHHGPYEEEGPAYAAVQAWIQEHGHTPIGAPREVYLVSPGDVADPSEYVTEIQFPVAPAE